VPEAGNPQANNRYAYVGNNPLRYVDPSGHNWGDVTDFIRKIPSYDTTLNNLNLALTIVQHPEATGGQKAMAAGYIALEGTAHAAVVVGGAILAWEGAAAAAGSSVVKAAGAKLTAWALTHWKEVVIAKAVAEEAIEAVSTETPFDPAMVVLDVYSQIGDDILPRRRTSLFSETTTPWGRTVHQRGDIDWDLVRPDGMTNLEAAVEGYAPGRIGADGTWEVVQSYRNPLPLAVVPKRVRP
jgi:hypothetical protein